MRAWNWKRHFFAHWYLALPVIVFIVVAASSAITSLQQRYPLTETLAPIPTPIGISGRKLFRFRQGECIVLCPPVELVSEEEQQRFRGTDEETELVRQVLPASSRWYTEPNHPEEQTTFNCATFAVGDVIGLSRADFLDPRAISATNWQNPAHILLQEFFQRLATFPLAKMDWHELDTLESLSDDDVVVFATHGSTEEYVHLGRIAKRQGLNRIISKMGRGPIVLGTFQRTAQVYHGRFDEIQIYRRR